MIVFSHELPSSEDSTVILTVPQLSVAVAVPYAGDSSHSCEIDPGTNVNSGAVLSEIEIVWLLSVAFKQASVADHVLINV